MRELIKNSALALISLITSFILCEILFRVLGGVSIFDLSNFRTTQVIQDQLVSALDYDPNLGWKLKAHLTAGTDDSIAVHTIDFGIRRNGPGDGNLRTGSIMVVGASFTAGSEVRDASAWPAQLEKLVGVPVVNAAEGGYAADQIVLRAEEMLPIVKPKILIVDLVSDNITGAGYSFNGYPKPFFTISDGKLVEHNIPVPRYVPPDKGVYVLRDLLGHFLIIHRFMAAYFKDYWFSTNSAKFVRIDNDAVEITCALLSRLKHQTDAAGIRMLLVVQYGGGYLMATDKPSDEILLVEGCAHDMGLQVADEHDELVAVLHRDANELKKRYVLETNGLLGHKSPYGNFEIAKMAAAALEEPPPSQPVQSQLDGAYAASDFDARNLLNEAAYSRLVARSAIVNTTRVGSSKSLDATYRIEPIGARGEHYASIGSIAITGGPYTTSLEVREDHRIAALRLQLLDDESNGAYIDIDLRTGDETHGRLGGSRDIRAGVQDLDGNWRRVWVSANLPKPGPATIIVQLGDSEGNLSFWPFGGSIGIRHLKLQRGYLPSAAQEQSSRQ